MRGEIAAIEKAHHGKVALYAEQLNTGRTVGIDPDLPVQTASVIKLAILFEAMEQVRAGKATVGRARSCWHPGDAVTGSGILMFLDAPLTMTLKDVLDADGDCERQHGDEPDDRSGWN